MDQFPTTLTAQQIWGAACQALSDNEGMYIKEVPSDSNKKTNKELVTFYAYNPDRITEQSIQDGIEVCNFLKGLTFKLLTDDRLPSYIKMLMTLASNDELKLTNGNIAYIASAPSVVIKMQVAEAQEKQIKAASGGLIGVEGDRVQLNVKIIKLFYSEKWERFYVTGITTNDQVVSFSTVNRRLTNVGSMVSIKAKVNKHSVCQFTKCPVTKLNFVKTGING